MAFWVEMLLREESVSYKSPLGQCEYLASNSDISSYSSGRIQHYLCIIAKLPPLRGVRSLEFREAGLDHAFRSGCTRKKSGSLE